MRGGENEDEAGGEAVCKAQKGDGGSFAATDHNLAAL